MKGLLPLKPQRAINPDKKEREREREREREIKRERERERERKGGSRQKRNQGQFDFLRQIFWQTRKKIKKIKKKKIRPWTAQNQNVFLGSFEASFGQSTR